MKTAVALVAALALVVAASAAAATKPPPKWYWTPDKTEKRLVASNPGLGTDEPGTILVADCAGKGKPRAARYVSFLCDVKWATQGVGLSGAYPYTVFVKIRPTGTGKMCVARGSFAAIDPACLTV